MAAERDLSIDVIKIVAMFGVIVLHTSVGFVYGGQALPNILFYTFVISIPLFFMSSGYLLLGRKNVGYKYSATKILNILKVVAVFVIPYWFVLSAYHRDFDLTVLLKNYVGSFLQGGLMWQFWYFGAMMLIYLLYPALNRLFLRSTKATMSILVGCMLVQWLAFQTNMLQEWGGEYAVCQTFRLYNWFFYFLLGGLIRKYDVKGTSLWLLLAVWIFTVAVEWRYSHRLPRLSPEFYHCSVPGILFSALTFIYFRSVTFRHTRIIGELSKMFLPVYALHVPIIAVTYGLWADSGYWGPLFGFLIVSFLSLLLSWIMLRIPLINKLLKL